MASYMAACSSSEPTCAWAMPLDGRWGLVYWDFVLLMTPAMLIVVTLLLAYSWTCGVEMMEDALLEPAVLFCTSPQKGEQNFSHELKPSVLQSMWQAENTSVVMDRVKAEGSQTATDQWGSVLMLRCAAMVS